MSIAALSANAWPQIPLPPALAAGSGRTVGGSGVHEAPTLAATDSSTSGSDGRTTGHHRTRDIDAPVGPPSATADTGLSAAHKTKQAGTGKPPATGQLSEAQLRIVDQLKARDREVRQHEAAHQAAGGAFVGGASFTYERGPDGQNYAIGGEVSVDTSAISGDPRQTIAKMRRVQAAALAPADPSAQDRHVAAQAQQAMLQAQQELLRMSSAKSQAGNEPARGRAVDVHQVVQAYANDNADAPQHVNVTA